jgi:hypothetical protein
MEIPMPKDNATKRSIGGATHDALVKGITTGSDELDEGSLAKVSGGEINGVKGEEMDNRHPPVER